MPIGLLVKGSIPDAKNLLHAAGFNTRRLLRKLKDRPVYIVFILIALYTTYFSYYTALNHYTFHTSAYDLGIYMQSLWTTIHGDGLFYTSLWEGSRFAIHFEPILFFILPFYAAIPRAETLLVLQSLVLALGALPIYWIAKDELGAKVGVAFAGLYLLYPALHGVNSFDFHGVALAITPLLFCFYMFKKKRYKWGMLFAVVAMMCRENVPLVVAFMGLYWLWVEREKVKSWLKTRSLPREREVIFPLCLVLIGILWFSLTVFVIIPHFNPAGGYPLSYRYESPFQTLFVDADMKAWYLFCLFGPLLFTSLLHPAILIGLPIFAQNLLSNSPPMYTINHQYTSLLIPWLFIASIYGVRWLAVKRRAIYAKLPYVLLPSVIIFALLQSPSPIALNRDMPHITAHHHALEQVIAAIPEGASVYTQNDIFPHICHRVHAYYTLDKNFFEGYNPTPPWGQTIPWSNGGNFDFILIDSTTKWSILKRADQESLDRLEEEYEKILKVDGIYLYRNKGYEGKPLVIP